MCSYRLFRFIIVSRCRHLCVTIQIAVIAANWIAVAWFSLLFSHLKLIFKEKKSEKFSFLKTEKLNLNEINVKVDI